MRETICATGARLKGSIVQQSNAKLWAIIDDFWVPTRHAHHDIYVNIYVDIYVDIYVYIYVDIFVAHHDIYAYVDIRIHMSTYTSPHPHLSC